MKKLLLFVAIAATSFASYSQALGYEDLALLFSRNDGNGSPRFTAMGGAFGALGGDVSVMTINPAGISVFNGGNASVSFQSRTTNNRATYYGISIVTEEEYLNISNAGAVFSFDTFSDSDWSKIAIGVNYRILADLDNFFTASGNSGFATFDTYPLDINNPAILYDFADSQVFNNDYNGEISEFNLAVSGEYKEKFHFGVGLNFYDITFSQLATLRERNFDVNGNSLNARFYQENFTSGAGVSISMGMIYKPVKSVRLGLSYQSPTWFTEILEESNIVNNDGYFGDTEIRVSNNNVIYDNTTGGNFPFQSLIYRLRTPSRLTASAAVVFGQIGLISFDYTSRNFKGLNLTGDDFSAENTFFDNQLRRTNSFSLGTEWRLGDVSFRGGYRYEQSPDVNAIDSDNLQAYSFGLGYNFGKFKLDISYANSTQTAIYNFYPQFNQVDPAELDIDNTMVNLGVSINL